MKENTKNNNSSSTQTMPGEIFQHLLNSIDEYAVILVSSSFNIVYWNKGAENVFGYKLNEILGRPLSRLMNLSVGESSDSWDDVFSEIKSIKESTSYNAMCVDWSNRTFPADIKFTPMSESYSGSRSFGVFIRDLSVRCRHEENLVEILEKRKDLLLEQQEFSNSINRHIITPLSQMSKILNSILSIEGLKESSMPSSFLDEISKFNSSIAEIENFAKTFACNV